MPARWRISRTAAATASSARRRVGPGPDRGGLVEVAAAGRHLADPEAEVDACISSSESKPKSSELRRNGTVSSSSPRVGAVAGVQVGQIGPHDPVLDRGQETVGDELLARHPGREARRRGSAAASRARGRPRRRRSARSSPGSGPARTGRRGAASRRRRHRAGAPPCSRSSGCRRSRPGGDARRPRRRSFAGELDGLVGGGVVDEDDLVDVLERDRRRRSARASSRRSAPASRRSSSGGVRSANSRLHVDGAAPPQRGLDGAQAHRERQQPAPRRRPSRPPRPGEIRACRASGRRIAW